MKTGISAGGVFIGGASAAMCARISGDCDKAGALQRAIIRR